MKQTKQQTYLFDFDGTLVDSMPTYISVMLRILDEHHVDYGEDIVKIITPLGYRGTAEYYQTLGIKTSVDELVALMRERALYEYAHRIGAKVGVARTLQELKRQGASLNVLTASPHAMLDPCLERLGLWELFDNVWSCEDFETTKSDPVIYQMAAERMECGVGDVIFMDDNVNAVRTAKLAGMQVFGIYDDSSRDCIKELQEASDRYLFSFDELIGDLSSKV